MDWIKSDTFTASIRYDTVRRSVGRNEWNSYKHSQNFWTEVFNPGGMTECSHGIHPVGSSTQKRQVSLGTAQPQPILASSVFDWVKTNLVPSLTGFFSLVITHPRLKSGATFYRPYRDFARESIFIRIRTFTTTNNHSALSVFAVKKRRLI